MATARQAIHSLLESLAILANLDPNKEVELTTLLNTNPVNPKRKPVIGYEGRLVFDYDVSEDSPVVIGTWVTVAHIVSLVIDGWTWSDILQAHPEISEDDIRAALAYTVEMDANSLTETRLNNLSEAKVDDEVHFIYQRRVTTPDYGDILDTFDDRPTVGRVIRQCIEGHILIEEYNTGYTRQICWDRAIRVHRID